jgi:hypothetical protein
LLNAEQNEGEQGLQQHGLLGRTENESETKYAIFPFNHYLLWRQKSRNVVL